VAMAGQCMTPPWRGLFVSHGVNIETEPAPDAVAAMQRLLDGVPERWRDAEVAWWPASAIDMWSEPRTAESLPGD
jgi:hypothetical protein